ncbi:Transposable element P transposase, partial [Stegodyphus mimosarum]
MLLSVIKEIEQIGFKIVCLISDNNIINRKAFELLTPNKLLQPVIPHPFDAERLLFILFDSVHILKCIRNNWLSSKNNGTLTFPDRKNYSIFQKAYLKNFEMLFQMEQKSLIKYGHLLSRKVLYLSSIQKQNVNLALKLLNEKNTTALKCISKHYPTTFRDIEGTCSFIETVVTWWKIMNVCSPYEGRHLNDLYREPIRFDNATQLNFLKDMTLWLKNWKLSVHSNNGLSPQTFQSLITVNEAVVQLIPYLFQKYKMDYILLGKFQTDDLEARFGAYRQLSGSNYYISFVQVLENERKLRFKSCVIVSAKNLNVPLKTLIPLEERSRETVDVNLYDDVLHDSFSVECVPDDVLPILTYISGFVVRKELNKKQCVTCITWFQLDKTHEDGYLRPFTAFTCYPAPVSF